ncbi:hypothetical protein FACS189421_09900 [Bacteroidia bacterium]|nr:hypothetical protein FACS189421_09900 [Bacteroidia bacterium]
MAIACHIFIGIVGNLILLVAFTLVFKTLSGTTSRQIFVNDISLKIHMDILTHICSGIAGATVIAAFVYKHPVKRLKVLAAGAIGGAFPDIDTISMWSRFDSTFGRLLGLSHTGKVIYGEKYWYSHHAFFHSIPNLISIYKSSIFVVMTKYIYFYE